MIVSFTFVWNSIAGKLSLASASMSTVFYLQSLFQYHWRHRGGRFPEMWFLNLPVRTLAPPASPPPLPPSPRVVRATCPFPGFHYSSLRVRWTGTGSASVPATLFICLHTSSSAYSCRCGGLDQLPVILEGKTSSFSTVCEPSCFG